MVFPCNIYHRDTESHSALSAEGVYVDQSQYCYSDTLAPLPLLQMRVFDNDVLKHAFFIGDANSRPGNPEVVGTRVVSPVYEDAGARVRIMDLLKEPRITAKLLLSNAKQVSTTLTDTALTITDDCGRLIVVDLSRNCLVRNLRV